MLIIVFSCRTFQGPNPVKFQGSSKSSNWFWWHATGCRDTFAALGWSAYLHSTDERVWFKQSFRNGSHVTVIKHRLQSCLNCQTNKNVQPVHLYKYCWPNAQSPNIYGDNPLFKFQIFCFTLTSASSSLFTEYMEPIIHCPHLFSVAYSRLQTNSWPLQ